MQKRFDSVRKLLVVVSSMYLMIKYIFSTVTTSRTVDTNTYILTSAYGCALFGYKVHILIGTTHNRTWERYYYVLLLWLLHSLSKRNTSKRLCRSRDTFEYSFGHNNRAMLFVQPRLITSHRIFCIEFFSSTTFLP